MKNKKSLLLLLPLLMACGGNNNSSKVSSNSSTPKVESTSSSKVENSSTVITSSSSNSTIKPTVTTSSSTVVVPAVLDLTKTIEELAKGVKVEVVGTETYDGNITNLYLKNTSKDKEFSFIKYNDADRTDVALHEYYAANEDDNYIYSTRLNVNNTYNYYKIYNPYTSEYYTWNDGYNNPFSLLEESNFEKVDDVTYSVNVKDLPEISASLTNLLYGNPGLNLTAFTMYLEEGKLIFEAFANFDGSTTYEYTFKAEVVASGIDVEMDYRDVPFANVEDAEFDTMLEALKQNNYTATVVNYDDGIEDYTSMFYSNPDKVYYEIMEYKSGFYVTEDNLIQEVKNVDGDFYKVGAPLEGSIDEVMPSFNISRSVFDVNEGVYTLKDGVEGDLSAIMILEAYADSLDEFTITKTAEGYEFRNVLGDYETVVTFTNIGSTDVGFTADSVLEPVVGTSWAEVVDEDSYQLLIDICGEEVASTIPVPDNYDTWYQLSEEPEYVMFAAEASETIDDDIFAYAMKLMDAGFMLSEEEGMNGGIMALIEATINDEYHVVVVEFMPYEGMFCVLVYIGE